MNPGRYKAVCVLIAVLSASPARAIDKVDSPNVDQGELDLEYSGSRTFDSTSAKDNLEDTEALIAYAPTDRWEVDVGGYFAKEPDQGFEADGMLLENFFQFFEKGLHWIDSGIMIGINEPTRAGVPGDVDTKLLLEKDVGKLVNIVNIGLEQQVGAHSSSGPDPAFEWSSSYAISDEFAPGFEIQSDFGPADAGLRFGAGQHYVGPAVYGTLIDHFHYELAYLEGINSAASDSAVRFLFQYQSHF